MVVHSLVAKVEKAESYSTKKCYLLLEDDGHLLLKTVSILFTHNIVYFFQFNVYCAYFEELESRVRLTGDKEELLFLPLGDACRLDWLQSFPGRSSE
jgi:hypothetical protein